MAQARYNEERYEMRSPSVVNSSIVEFVLICDRLTS